MITKRSSSYKSLVGIELDDKRIHVAAVQRTGQECKVKAYGSAPLSLDIFTHEPELIGQEIRNHLEQLGIRESSCIVCLPLQWVMSHSIELPELSADDERNYISLHAEREFPFSSDDLILSTSRYRTSKNQQHATVAAVPANHVRILQSILKSAKLRPVSFSVASASLQDSESQDGKIVLTIKETCMEFLIRSCGGIASMRCLEKDVFDPESDEEDIVKNIAREIRISLGQLSGELRETIRQVYLYGSKQYTDPLFPLLQEYLGDMGLQVHLGNPSSEFPLSLAGNTDQTYLPIVKTVIRFLVDSTLEFDFLPPQINRFALMTQRISSRRNLVLGASAIGILFIVTIAFVYQHFRLSQLESQWIKIKDKVAQVEEIQKKVKKYRPWFDSSTESLSIMRNLTGAFPEEGTVWAKMMTIEQLSMVTCSGIARNRTEWVQLWGQLQKNPAIADLRFIQLEGDTPTQFSINFRWKGDTEDGQ